MAAQGKDRAEKRRFFLVKIGEKPIKHHVVVRPPLRIHLVGRKEAFVHYSSVSLLQKVRFHVGEFCFATVIEGSVIIIFIKSLGQRGQGERHFGILNNGRSGLGGVAT